MYLQPDSANEMHGRSGFFMHADSIAHPGQASEGCIVMDALTRMYVSTALDRELLVVE
jgi:hypothetical protein